MFKATYFFSLICVMSVPALSQTIEGTVTDEKGNPLTDVHIQNSETGTTAVTGKVGLFLISIRDLSFEQLLLTISRVGYKSERLTISQQETKSGNFVEIQLSSTVYESETIVVTATRTLRDVEDVSIPVSVVSGEEINRSGSMRLSDILSEQTGMQIVNDHGTGIQV